MFSPAATIADLTVVRDITLPVPSRFPLPVVSPMLPSRRPNLLPYSLGFDRFTVFPRRLDDTKGYLLRAVLTKTRSLEPDPDFEAQYQRANVRKPIIRTCAADNTVRERKGDQLHEEPSNSSLIVEALLTQDASDGGSAVQSLRAQPSDSDDQGTSTRVISLPEAAPAPRGQLRAERLQVGAGPSSRVSTNTLSYTSGSDSDRESSMLGQGDEPTYHLAHTHPSSVTRGEKWPYVWIESKGRKNLRAPRVDAGSVAEGDIYLHKLSSSNRQLWVCVEENGDRTWESCVPSEEHPVWDDFVLDFSAKTQRPSWILRRSLDRNSQRASTAATTRYRRSLSKPAHCSSD